MNGLSSSQKKIYNQFISVSNCPTEKAISYLSKNGWKLESALDAYFNGPPSINENQVKELFSKYKNPNHQKILLAGTQKLLEDLYISPSSVLALAFAWKCQAKVQAEFTLDEFLLGMRELRSSNINELKKNLNELDLNNPEVFKSLYQYTFSFANVDKTYGKNLGYDVATAYWKLLFKEKYPHLDLWYKFLEEEHKQPITRDTWNLFFEFIRTVNEDLSNYDKDGAWPVVLDSFVEYVAAQTVEKQMKL